MIRRVLHISLHADPLTYGDSGAIGGQQILIRELVKNIQYHGYGVDVLTAQANPLWPEKFSLGHLGQVIRIAPGLHRNEESRWIEAVDALVDSALKWILDSGREYHLIHSHYWISGLVAEQIHQRLGIPWVHSPVKMAQWTNRPGEQAATIRLEVERRLLEEPQAVVVSYLSEADIIHRGNPEVPVYVVPPGVDLTQFFSRDPGPVLRSRGLTRRPIMYLGRLELARGLRQALEVLSQRNLPDDLVLMIVGGTRREVQRGVPISPDLARFQERLGSHVQFIGGMPHRGVAPYLAAAEVVVAPNQGPTLGMAVLESMASGIPVVGASVPGVRDWIDSDRDGYLVDPSDMEGLWDYALQLWQNPNQARKMGTLAQDKVQRLHSVNHMAEQMAACYQEVTGIGRDQVDIGV